MIKFLIHTCIDADSLRNSLMTIAKASGLTPASINLTQIDKLSESKPVLSKVDISIRAETK